MHEFTDLIFFAIHANSVFFKCRNSIDVENVKDNNLVQASWQKNHNQDKFLYHYLYKFLAWLETCVMSWSNQHANFQQKHSSNMLNHE